MIIVAGEHRLVNECIKIIDRTTGKHVDGFMAWDTKEQEGTIYNPDLFTQFTIQRSQYKQLAREYGGKEKLDEDIEHNRVKLVIVD